MNIEIFEDTTFSKLRRELLNEKGSRRQRQFLRLLLDREEFCQYLAKRVNIDPGIRLPLMNQGLTEENYRELPINAEGRIFEQWQEIVPADACSPSLWGLLTFRHIQEGIIEPYFLVEYKDTVLGTKEWIIRIADDGTKDEADRMVRMALRSFYGLKEIEGNRGIYVHCVLSRGWWRGYLRNEVCKQTSADPVKVAQVFYKSPTYWKRLIRFTVSRNSVLGDMRVRDALVWALSEQVEKKEYAHIFTPNTLDKIVRLIGIRSAWQELGVFSMDELKEMMEKKFIAVVL